MKTIAKIGESVFNLIKEDRDYNFLTNGSEFIKASKKTGKIAGREEYVEYLKLLEDKDVSKEAILSLGISDQEYSILLDSMDSEYNSVLQKCVQELKIDEDSLCDVLGKIYDLEKKMKDSARITNKPTFAKEEVKVEKILQEESSLVSNYLPLVPSDLTIVEIVGGVSIKDKEFKKVFSIWNVRMKKGVLLCTLSLNQVVLKECVAPSELEILDFKGKFPYFNNITFEQVEELLKSNDIIKS